jgi:sulfoquinovosidase
MKSLSIEFATLDLTNPSARSWMKEILINYTLLEGKSSGWMCDFGEYLPFDSVLYSNISAAEYHNFYPQAWAELTYEIISEYRTMYPDAPNIDAMFFMRSGYLESSKYLDVYWLGDQLMSWDGSDGLLSVVTGALSSGK